MKHKAKRPCLIDLRSGAFDDEDLATLRLNANDVVAWEDGDCIPELGHSIFQVVFKGYPIQDDATLTTLGSVCYDACDYGLDIYQIIGDALYEARHPWLDYQDAVKKKILPYNAECVVVKQDDGHIWHELIEGHHLKGLNGSVITAFKPIKPFEYAYFQNVEVWQG